MIDMREANKANFVDAMMELTSTDRQSIEPYIRQISYQSEKLWYAAETNNVELITDLLDKELQNHMMVVLVKHHYFQLHMVLLLLPLLK